MTLKLEIFTDGAARGNPGPAGIGVVIFNEEKAVIEEYKEFIGDTTNNTAEYKALLAALKTAKKYAPCSISFCLDSELVVHQMKGQWKVRDANLSGLHDQASALLSNFEKVEFKHVPREQNKLADKLANQALDAVGK
jgi:ribonuclease HI